MLHQAKFILYIDNRGRTFFLKHTHSSVSVRRSFLLTVGLCQVTPRFIRSDMNYKPKICLRSGASGHCWVIISQGKHYVHFIILSTQHTERSSPDWFLCERRALGRCTSECHLWEYHYGFIASMHFSVWVVLRLCLHLCGLMTTGISSATD